MLAGTDALEADRAVTFLTLAAELPQVDVILGVTRGAFGTELHLRGRLPVATCAVQLCVRTEQREARLFAMVEVPQAPAIGGVAFLTLRPQAALVGVVLLVAIDARSLATLKVRLA